MTSDNVHLYRSEGVRKKFAAVTAPATPGRIGAGTHPCVRTQTLGQEVAVAWLNTSGQPMVRVSHDDMLTDISKVWRFSNYSGSVVNATMGHDQLDILWVDTSKTPSTLYYRNGMLT